MATIDAYQSYTIADIAKATAQDGKVLPIYDSILRRAPALNDAVWQPANRPELHRMNVSDTAVTGTLVGLNEGVKGTKKILKTVDEYMARIEDNSLVDTRMKDYYTEIIAFRDKMDRLKLADLNFQLNGMIFSGNQGTDPKQFNGLAARLKSTSDGSLTLKVDTAGSFLESIYFVNWGEDTVFMVHPKGSKTFGSEVEDRSGPNGVRVLDANSYPYYAYESWITVQGGLAVQEPKAIARIANIDTSVADIWTSKKVMSFVNKLVPKMNTKGKIYAYMSPAMYGAFQDYIQGKTNIIYKIDEFGAQVTEFAGITWRTTDSLGTASETLVA